MHAIPFTQHEPIHSYAIIPPLLRLSPFCRDRTDRAYWVGYFAPRDRKRTATQAITPTPSSGTSPRRKPRTVSLSTLSPSRRPSISARKPVRPIDFIHDSYMSLPASTHPLEAVQGALFSLFQANVYSDLSLTRDEKAHLLNETYQALASALPPFDFCADKPITLDKIQKVLLLKTFSADSPCLTDPSTSISAHDLLLYLATRASRPSFILNESYTHTYTFRHFWQELFDYSPTNPTAPLSPLEDRERLQSELAYYLSFQLVDA